MISTRYGFLVLPESNIYYIFFFFLGLHTLWQMSDIQTNVPTIRLAYRHATLLEELTLINHGRHAPSATPTHLKSVTPTATGPGQSTQSGSGPGAPAKTTGDRPGLSSHPSDVGAAAMAVSGGIMPENGVPHLIGAATVLDDRARKRSSGQLKQPLEKSHEIRR